MVFWKFDYIAAKKYLENFLYVLLKVLLSCLLFHKNILCLLALWNRGQHSIYFPIGDHVNVSWCRSHTNASGVIAT